MNVTVDNRQTLLSTQALLDASPHSYAVRDQDHIILGVSSAYLRMTGATESDLVGKSIYGAFPDNPDDLSEAADMLRQSLNNVLKTGEPDTVEFRHPIPLRVQPGIFVNHWWGAINTPIRTDGEITGVLHHSFDITDRILAERTEAVRKRLLDNLSSVAFWEYIPATGDTTVSSALGQMFNMPHLSGVVDAELLFSNLSTTDAADLRSKFASAEDKQPGTVVEAEYRLDLNTGDERWIHLRSELLRNNPHEPARFIGVVMDVTSARAKSSELAAALSDRDTLLEQKETLLQEVNHRVKNSLQIVSSVLRMDARSAVGDEAKNRLSKASERVNAVAAVHELIYKAKQVSTVEFGPYLNALCAALEASGAVQIKCQSDPVKVSTDAAISIALLVNELVSNALEHAFGDRTDGVIEVISRCSDNQIIISVADNGAGHAEGASTGLGTSIIESMVVQLDGYVETGPNNDGSNVGHKVLVNIPL